MNKQMLRETQCFFKAIDEMLASKFVFVDKCIGRVLSSIAESKPVYNIVAECIVSYNFDKEFRAATSSSKFFMPEEPEKIVPFVFILLSNIDDKKIDIVNFVDDYFGETNSYQNFLSTVIEPFKNAITKLLTCDSENEPVKEEVNNKFTKDLSSRLVFLLSNFEEKIKNAKKPEKQVRLDIITIVDIMIMEAKKLDSFSVYGLYLGIKNIISSNKSLLSEFSKIDEIINLIR